MNTMKYLHVNDVTVYNAVMELINTPTTSDFTVAMAKARIRELMHNLPMHYKLHIHLENILKKSNKSLRTIIIDEMNVYEDYLSILATDPNDDEWDLMDVDVERAKTIYANRTNFPKKVVDLIFSDCVK
jgi:hypothetical protein